MRRNGKRAEAKEEGPGESVLDDVLEDLEELDREARASEDPAPDEEAE